MHAQRILVLLAVLAALAVPALAKPSQGLRYPSLAPDGKQVAFAYRGDIFVAPVDGKGPAQRLTLHIEQETLPRISPDGKKVVFCSRRNGNYDLFTLPLTGGVPERITFNGAYEMVCDWSPDGKKVLFTTVQEIGRWGMDLFEVDLEKGGTPRRITLDGGRDGAYSPDGKWIVYARGFNTIYWDNYEGSANYDLYVIPAEGGPPRRLTQTDGNERYPFFSRDGKTIYFVAEEKGVANFYSMPVSGGKRTQVTKYEKDDVHRPDLNWDHETVVFERVGRLYTANLTKPAKKPTPIKLTVNSDVRNSGVERRTITHGGEQVHISPDGRQAAFTLRGDIWIMPAAGGTGRRITSSPANEQWPRFSPNGKQLAYFSNASGNNDIYLHDLQSGETRPLTKNKADDFFQNWSPDGLELVFTSERSGNRDIWLLDIESGQTTQLTRHEKGDDDPTFSPDGRQIAFDSARDGSQAVYVMNRDGTAVRRVTQRDGYFQVPSFSPDSRLLVYEGYSPTTGRSGGLYVVSVTGGPSVQISRDGQTACWTAKGDYIYFTARRGPGRDGVFRVRAPESVDVGERVPFVGTVEIDIRKELGTLFDEIWAALKERFYDPKMHGVDWDAMKKKYRAMAIEAEVKVEFHSIVRQMLAELGASHLGIMGSTDSGNSVTPPPTANGYFGCEFEQKALEDGTRRVAYVVPGSPADKAGLRVGDIVTRIGKAKLTAKTNLDKVTAGITGKETPVTFRPRTESGLGVERTVGITAVGINDIWQLKYKEWVATCARRVEEATKTKKSEVGYIHLRQMNGENLQRFQQAVSRWNRSKKIKGMILDIRNNGGGNIHNQLIGILMSKPLARIQVRGGQKMVQPSLYWDRPVVVLINERSFSDAEVFPAMFKAAGIGKIIGVPTAGGVIGTNQLNLSDGSSLRIPRVGYWTMDGKNLEGHGVQPDVYVELTSEDRLTGRDPQLEKAIEVISAEVKEREAQAKKTETKEKPKAQPKPEPKKDPKLDPAPGPKVEVVAEIDPLADVSVGEWVRYRWKQPGSDVETTFKVTVTKVEGDTVFFDEEIEKGAALDLPLPRQLGKVGILEVLKGYGKLLSHAVVEGEVGGAATRILRARIAWPDGTPLTFSITNAVPAYGLYRIEMHKQVALEAVEWGRAAAAKPVVEQPQPEPKPEPEAPKPEPEAKAPAHPVYDAQVGEWVKLKSQGRGGQEVFLIYKVTEVTEDEVVFSQTMVLGGREVEGPERRRPRHELLQAPENFDLVGFAKETITVADESLECHVMTASDPNGVEWKWYVCPAVPFNGYVRIERDGDVIMEVVEWGTE